MKIEREILGIEVTIHFDDHGNIENIEVDRENLQVLNDNAIDFHNRSKKLVTGYFDGLREESEDRRYELKRGC
jgi:hypothetical protein